MPEQSLDVADVRTKFAGLADGYVYADNAGGSQCLTAVVARISDYLLHTNVQLGADYSASVSSTQRVKEGLEAARELFHAESADEISLGSSSTMLLENLSRAMEPNLVRGDEIIITGEHEANAGPWKKLAARRGLTVKVWHATQSRDAPNNPYSVVYDVETLLPLITTKTRLVAFSACSNILGSIVPVKEVAAAIRTRATQVVARKVEICVDCVAYAPHRTVHVRNWDIDYCVISMYKLYGPHIGALYTRAASLSSSLNSLAHHFLKVDDRSYKLQPGGPGYELVYGLTAISEYLRKLSPARSLTDTFEQFGRYEQSLIVPLLAFLKSKEARGVRIVGEERASMTRVPTISFVVVGDRAIKSRDVVKAFDKKGKIGIRYGHFYAYTLMEHLEPKLDLEDGVVRISLVHYNTVGEVQTIIEVLEEVLA